MSRKFVICGACLACIAAVVTAVIMAIGIEIVQAQNAREWLP